MARTGCESLRILCTAAVSRLKVAGSMSAKTGVAPQRVIELADAKNVKGGVITRSPGRTPAAESASHKASVPEEQPTQSLAPKYSADSRSNASSSGPPTKYCVVRTRSMATATSFLIDSYWRLRSSIGTGADFAVLAGATHEPPAVTAKFSFYSAARKQCLAGDYLVLAIPPPPTSFG